jgi:hypothetical protein
MDSKHMKCVPIVRWLWCDAQCVNRKINHIPNMIDLVGKIPKTYDNRKTHKQCLVKALECRCEHPGVIKFLAIHTKTMEAYTLWWNGGTFRKMLDYNMKYSPIMDNRTLLWQGGHIWKGEHDLSPLGKIV